MIAGRLAPVTGPGKALPDQRHRDAEARRLDPRIRMKTRGHNNEFVGCRCPVDLLFDQTGGRVATFRAVCMASISRVILSCPSHKQL